MMARQMLMWLGVCLTLHAQSSIISLSDAYNKALFYEAKLRSVAYQVDAKIEDVKITESQLYPQLYASVDHSNREYKDNFYKRNTKEAYYSSSLTASQVLYHPEIVAQVESAELKVDSAKVYLSKQQQELAYKVTDAYISILKYQNSVSVARSYVKTNEIKHQQIAEKFDLHLSNKMDFLESKLAYEQAIITLHKQENLLAVAKIKLKNLIGVDVIDMPSIEFDTLDLEQLLYFSSQEDLQKNPDIMMAKIGTQIYEKEIEVAKYGHYPKLDLSVTHTEYNTKDATVDYERDSRVMLEFKIPLYQGGRVSSQIEKNRVMLNSAREDLTDQQREVRIKYEELLLNYESALKDITLHKEAEKSASLYLSAVQKGHEYGLKNLIDLEDAKTKLFETKFKLIDSVYTFINAYVGILNVTGKLSPNDLEKLNSILFKMS